MALFLMGTLARTYEILAINMLFFPKKVLLLASQHAYQISIITKSFFINEIVEVPREAINLDELGHLSTQHFLAKHIIAENYWLPMHIHTEVEFDTMLNDCGVDTFLYFFDSGGISCTVPNNKAVNLQMKFVLATCLPRIAGGTGGGGGWEEDFLKFLFFFF
ncbi:hypothetical protein ACJX0J_019013 [Zea mays]